MSYTEVTNTSYLSRIGSSLKGILFGLVLMLIAFSLLFWNEGRAVKQHKTLQEGSSIVISVASAEVDPAAEGKLVHIFGMAESEESLTDQQFGVQSPHSIKLKRVVNMYQWKESSTTKTEKKLGGGEQQTTTYTYSKEWSGNPIQSGSFKQPEGHQNPGTMHVETHELTAEKVNLGAFLLTRSLVAKINSYKPLAIDSEIPLPQVSGRSGIREINGFYFGRNASQSEVGDLRISYEVINPLEVSIVAVQTGNTLKPYQSEAGGQIEMLEMGIHAADAMFQQAIKNNTLITWLARAGGFLLMFLGVKLIVGPLSVLADVVPAVGSLVGAGTGLIAFLFSGVVSFLTIGIAWIFFRPLVGGIALAIAGVLLFFIISKMKKSDAPPVASSIPPTPPPPPAG